MFQLKQMLKHSSIYALGNVSRNLVGFLMLPVYTRYLTPADYGVIGLLLMMISLVELLFGGHMAHAVSKFYYDQDSPQQRKTILSTAFILTGMVSIPTVVIVMLTSHFSSQILFGSIEYSLLVKMFAVLVITHALENYALVYIRIQQRPWFYVGVNTVKLVMQLGLNLFFVVYQEMGVMGVALSSMLSSIIFSVFLTGYTLIGTGIQFCKTAARKLFRFSWPLWIGGLAGLYIGSSNRYYIQLFSSLEEVGLFELAAKFGAIIMLLIWMPFSQYWQTERFNIYKQKNSQNVFIVVFELVSFGLIAVALGVALFSDIMIRIMANPEFHRASLAVPFLAAASVFNCLTIFNNFSFLVKEKTKWMSRNSYVVAVIITIFYLLFIPKFGFVGAAMGLCFGSLAQFIIVFFAAKKQFDMKLPILGLVYALGVYVLVVVLAQRLLNESMLVDFLIKSLIYILSLPVLVLPLLRKYQKYKLSGLVNMFSKKTS